MTIPEYNKVWENPKYFFKRFLSIGLPNYKTTKYEKHRGMGNVDANINARAWGFNPYNRFFYIITPFGKVVFVNDSQLFNKQIKEKKDE